MAYRFNPPPNWPIDDANWSPPPGWQPDPSWGPAPEGWNFWVEGEAPPAAASAPSAPGAEEPAPVEDDATRVVSTDQRADAVAAEEPASTEGAGQDQADQQVSVQDEDPYPEPVSQQPPSEQHDETAQPLPEDPAGHGRHVALPAEDPAPDNAVVGAPIDADETHLAGTGEQDHLAHGEDSAATGDEASAGGGPSAGSDPIDGAPSSETTEYQGPDLEAGLAQAAPYESAEPVSSAPYGSVDGSPDQAQQDHGYGTAAVAGGAAAGGTAAYGTQDAANQGYGQASPAAGYGQASPSQGYGQASPAAGYGQASANQGFGQASPSAGYGQGSASEYPAQGYGQNPASGSPSVDTGSGWTAATAPGEAPKKGALARFWWVGCIVLFLVGALILAVIGGFLLFNRADDTAGGDGDPTTVTEEEGTSDTPTEEETSEEEATTEEEAVTPTDLPTIDASATPIDVVSSEGAGTVAVHMAWVPAEDLPSLYGDTVEPGDNGDYLVMTAKMTVTEGTMGLNPFNFEVVTPYGGVLTPATESFGLAGSGLDIDAPDTFAAGEEYTVRVLFDPVRASGLTLEFDNYTDVYSWDVPA